MLKAIGMSLALALALVTSAQANNERPPERFRHAPEVKIIEQQLDITKIKLACKRLMKTNGASFKLDSYTWGCAVFDASNACHIIYPDKNGRGMNLKLHVREHEIGHCNGWSSKHES